MNTNINLSESLRNIHSIGNLPQNPSKQDLIEYAIKNNLLQEGEGTKILLEKARQELDIHSQAILHAALDAIERKQENKNPRVTGSTWPKWQTNAPRLPANNPQQFLKYAQTHLNDVMGAWITRRSHLTSAQVVDRNISNALRETNDELAASITDVLDIHGIKRAETINPHQTIDTNRLVLEYLSRGNKIHPIQRLAQQNTALVLHPSINFIISLLDLDTNPDKETIESIVSAIISNLKSTESFLESVKKDLPTGNIEYSLSLIKELIEKLKTFKKSHHLIPLFIDIATKELEELEIKAKKEIGTKNRTSGRYQ